MNASHRRRREIQGSLAVLITVGVMAACTGGEDLTVKSVPPDKAKQTWTKAYDETTCADWANTMTQEQRMIAASDLLTGERSADGANSLPPEDMINEFAGGISKACENLGTQVVSKVSDDVYSTGRDKFVPRN